ncbi:phosphatidate cytidylyltransferase [Qipengyuania thermophila]|uniref:phosphatidate cytidylyltransferase n=1 Tax=Qipengyuania thermophila TaxID=2509361 RepID=UPI001F228E87|nr:phosphatidate cytidylyltransferase [Qipengyuania thermophila]
MSRRRDRIKARAKRFVELPLALRTSDLPRRLVSAIVMIAVASGALWLGGWWLDALVIAVALACFGELVRLVLRATRKPLHRILGVGGGAVYIGAATWILVRIDNPLLFLLIVASVVFVDTFAYLFGRTLGGPKIAPRVSPSKTWAGLFGGIVGAMTVLLLFSLVEQPGAKATEDLLDFAPGTLMLIGVMVALCAQAGDFLESWIKRRALVKDSSRLIPGHGGIFDRVDGMLPVAILLGGSILHFDPVWAAG